MGSTKDEIKINKAILNLLNISRHTVRVLLFTGGIILVIYQVIVM